MSILSFHTTKLFHTLEGKAIVTNDLKLKKRVELYLRLNFYPLISRITSCPPHPSATPGHLPVAEMLNRRVLGLPMYSELELTEVDRICKIMKGE